MKSKKKLLLMGVGVMGALAMGVGATSTFAWYQVTQHNALESGIISGKQQITADDPTGQFNEEIYLKLTVSLENNELDMTTVDGYSYGVTNEHQVVGYVPETSFGTVSLSAAAAKDATKTESAAAAAGSTFGWKWYTDAACETAADSTTVANIVAGSANVVAAAGSRVRITLTNPEADVDTATGIYDNAFYTAFNGTLGDNDLDVGDIAVAIGGGVTGSIAFYYSISGEATDVTKATVDGRAAGTMNPEATISATDLQITFTLAVVAS